MGNKSNAGLTERRIVRKISRLINEPLNDDCAYMKSGGTYLAFTIDSISEGTHIPPGAKPQDIGWYAVGVSLSDLASSGADPWITMVSLVIPEEKKGIITRIMRGAYECATRYASRIVGGDTKQGSQMTITTVCVGRTSSPVTRSGAQPGEHVYLTGCVGRPASIFYQKRPDPERLLRIYPRCELAGFIRRNATSCIDLSDGVVTSLYHISESSKCRLQIDLSSIPIDDGIALLPGGFKKSERVRIAINFGGDYELLFTSAEDIPGVVKGVRVTRIGRVLPGRGVVDSQGKPIPDYGYEHFSRRWIGKRSDEIS